MMESLHSLESSKGQERLDRVKEYISYLDKKSRSSQGTGYIDAKLSALKWMVSLLGKLTKENEELRECLQELLEIQNGPPLPTYEDAWNEIVEKGWALVNPTDNKGGIGG